MIGSTRSRTGFGLGRAALSRRCWRRNFPRRCRDPRHGRRKPGEDERRHQVVGVRHGHRRERTLTGTFGKTRIAVPRARLTGEDGKTREWRSGSLRAYQRRTRAADALIAGAYLCRDQHPPRAPRVERGVCWPGRQGRGQPRLAQDEGRLGRAWNARSLAEQPIVRLILDGTVARVRLSTEGRPRSRC